MLALDVLPAERKFAFSVTDDQLTEIVQAYTASLRDRLAAAVPKTVPIYFGCP